MCHGRRMGQDFEVTVRLRVTVEDPAALLAAAGDEVPAALRSDELVAIQAALQAVVRPPDVEQVPGIRGWRGLGWHAQVSAEPLQG